MGHGIDTCPQKTFNEESKNFFDAFPEAKKAFQYLVVTGKLLTDLANTWDHILTEFINQKKTQDPHHRWMTCAPRTTYEDTQSESWC